MKIQFTNVDRSYFEGFYESSLYNSDSEYYLNELKDESEPELEVKDFKGFCNAVGKYVVDTLNSELDSDSAESPLGELIFKGIDSPQFYNFTTDKLILETDINVRKMKSYLKKNLKSFADYLDDHFTSYDGFISFVEPTVEGFFAQMKEGESEHNRGLGIIADFIIQNELGESGLEKIRENSCYSAHELLCRYAEPVTESESSDSDSKIEN